MTVITGETGASKSIMLDAWACAWATRPTPGPVRHGSERAEVVAGLISAPSPGQSRLAAARDLHTGEECLLRRVVTAEGRSRAYHQRHQLDPAGLRRTGRPADRHPQPARTSVAAAQALPCSASCWTPTPTTCH